LGGDGALKGLANVGEKDLAAGLGGGGGAGAFWEKRGVAVKDTGRKAGNDRSVDAYCGPLDSSTFTESSRPFGHFLARNISP